LIPDPDPNPKFYAEYHSGSGSRVLITKNVKKITTEKFIFLFIKKCILLTIGLHKGVLATGEAFSTEKKTFSTSKHVCLIFFLILWVIFALLDPDLKHCYQH
jgi:hypothetical protein